MNLKIKNTTGITFDGKTLSGNTYPVKDWIKTYVDGKWNANAKSWTVDAAKVEKWLKAGAIHQDNSQPVVNGRTGSTSSNGWCNKCHSYCWGDCEAN